MSSFDAKIDITPVPLSDTARYKTELRKVSREFEGMLLAQMFRVMKQTIPEGGLIEKSNGQDLYEDMFYTEVARSGALSQGVGFAETIYRSLSGNVENATSTSADAGETSPKEVHNDHVRTP